MPPGLAGAGATLGAGLEGAEKELDLLALDPELTDELDRPPPELLPPERPIEPASATVATIAVETTKAENSLETFIG
jgi:hypothetical protein